MEKADGHRVENAEPPVEFFVETGKFLRNCAELEDTIEAHLFAIAGVDEIGGRMLVGRSTIGTKIAKLRYAITINPVAKEGLSAAIPAFEKLVSLRNILAHGAYMGVIYAPGSVKPVYAFHTSKDGDTSDQENTMTTLVETVPLSQIKAGNEIIEGLLPFLRAFGFVQEMREERLQQFLTNLRARQRTQPPKQKKSDKKRRPPSSEG